VLDITVARDRIRTAAIPDITAARVRVRTAATPDITAARGRIRTAAIPDITVARGRIRTAAIPDITVARSRIRTAAARRSSPAAEAAPVGPVPVTRAAAAGLRLQGAVALVVTWDADTVGRGGAHHRRTSSDVHTRTEPGDRAPGQANGHFVGPEYRWGEMMIVQRVLYDIIAIPANVGRWQAPVIGSRRGCSAAASRPCGSGRRQEVLLDRGCRPRAAPRHRVDGVLLHVSG
jgi:hypothetical protein